MMSELLGVQGALGALGIALVIFGLAPGLVLSLVVRMLAKDDPRRAELPAELYAVPRWERPFWVCDQIEVALRTGLAPEVSWFWGRWIWHRAKVESGMEMHRQHPDSFWVPEPEVKAALRPGDRVKLMWTVKRYQASGERMWVEVLERKGDRLRGRLLNWPVFVHLSPDERVQFRIDDIIDYRWVEDVEADCGCHDDHGRKLPPAMPAPPADGSGLYATHTECNGPPGPSPEGVDG